MHRKIPKLFLCSLFAFGVLLAKIDRLCLKASQGFCLHFIDVPLTPNPAWEISTPFPKAIFDQPFTYLGKGAQNFVFESQDQNYVLKFYKFPSHMRRFSWMNHPLGYLFSPKRIALKQHNLDRFHLSYHSYFLAHQYLQQETGVVYIHLNPTPGLQKNVHLIDKTGHHYQLSLAKLGFALQVKGEPFLPLLHATLETGNLDQARHMIDSLFHLIICRCSKGITDLDNMEHNNYGWAKNDAIHLDVGRFSPSNNLQPQQEVVRITAPLSNYLEKNSPELFQYYQQKISEISY